MLIQSKADGGKISEGRDQKARLLGSYNCLKGFVLSTPSSIKVMTFCALINYAGAAWSEEREKETASEKTAASCFNGDFLNAKAEAAIGKVDIADWYLDGVRMCAARLGGLTPEQKDKIKEVLADAGKNCVDNYLREAEAADSWFFAESEVREARKCAVLGGIKLTQEQEGRIKEIKKKG